jgi:diaminohydroxyphosphoribosylaminopyrimidine deaminase/5-amino-6-(5-phosphoribosylamino)uracil reductase
MSLDGKIATATGDSRWISSEASRRIVHELRGRVDAIMVGRKTAEVDDPLLTARPAGPRTATRIVLDSQLSLPDQCRLLQTVGDAPVLIVASEAASRERIEALQKAGAEILCVKNATREVQLGELLDELGRRRMTSILVEGGGELLGALYDADLIDEVHVFIAAKLIGGDKAPSPLAGVGAQKIADAAQLESIELRQVGEDVYLQARIARGESQK